MIGSAVKTYSRPCYFCTRNKKKSILALGIFIGALIALATGTACTTPQVIHEVQSAEPIAPGATKMTVSGGLSWSPNGLYTLGTPNIPNGDISVLLRHAFINSKDLELQFPLSASFRLAPGIDTYVDEWFAGQVSSGPLWKMSCLLEDSLLPASAISNHYDRAITRRPLYNSYIGGPRIGALVTNCATVGSYSGERSIWPDTVGGKKMPRFIVLPYAGIYYKYIKERRAARSIRMNGFILNANIYLLPSRLHTFLFDPLELFVGGLTGGDHASFVFQFTYGIIYQHLYGPKLFMGTTFASKPGKQRKKESHAKFDSRVL